MNDGSNRIFHRPDQRAPAGITGTFSVNGSALSVGQTTAPRPSGNPNAATFPKAFTSAGTGLGEFGKVQQLFRAGRSRPHELQEALFVRHPRQVVDVPFDVGADVRLVEAVPIPDPSRHERGEKSALDSRVDGLRPPWQ